MKNAKEKMNGKDVQKLFYKTNPMGGISLIVLVITIIIIIILAAAVIVSIVGNNPIAEARKAVDDSNIKTYTEQIEMIKAKIMLENDEYEFPTIYQIKEKLDKEKWARSTEVIMDEGIEKLKLITKEGYIFYITEEETEYKGKGKVVDTSALKRDDVIELKAEEETSNGQNVRITSKAEERYTLKYKIGEGDKWTEIESGNAVEVPFGETIYAKLFYGNNAGVEFKLKVGESKPTIVAKSTDTSNMKRKTDTALANLFDITWGSEGTGTVEYEVTGILLFDNSSIDGSGIENTKDLELGTYYVKCTIKNPSGNYTDSAQKEVKITTLADTSVTNASGNNVNASAIYSEYDLSYFRDLVNGSNQSQNARLIENINLANVCSTSLSWLPIGNSNASKKYQGIFDGNDKKVYNIYINSSNADQGLFGYTENATIKNVMLGNGSIQGNYNVGGICGNSNNSSIKNCSNENTKIVAKNYIRKTYTWKVAETHSFSNVGGIIGYGYNCNIDSCNNKGVVDGYHSAIGGIIGFDDGNKIRIINNCTNNSSFTVTFQDEQEFGVGGIVGESYKQGEIQNCSNIGSITCNQGVHVGGIVGNLCGTIQDCNNSGKIKAKAIVGGIAGGNETLSIIDNCINDGEITATNSIKIDGHYRGKDDTWQTSSVGGITGLNNGGNISLCKNYGNIVGNIYCDLGGIVGHSRSNSSIKRCSNYIDILNSKESDVGGVVGYANQCTIEECFNVGNISGKDAVGGVAGETTYTTVKNCYNTGNINAEMSAGGIIGVTLPYEFAIGYEYFFNCYNVGNVTAGENSDNWIGYSEYVSYGYMYTTKSLYDTIGDGCWLNQNGTIWEAISGTDEQIKSKMLTNLLKSYGAGKWTRDTTEAKNDGYPYLKYNLPE